MARLRKAPKSEGDNPANSHGDGGGTPPAVDSASTTAAITPLRRSGRVRKPVAGYGLEQSVSPRSTPGPVAPPVASASARRNPKRKAAPEVFDIPEKLLESSVGPWKEEEQAEWASWTEVESDPAFFNVILERLGVMGARIEELFSIDGDSLTRLPAPVYGLIFLYQYVEEVNEPTDTSVETPWFANQTTNNACATIAMLNILMNAEGLPLGEKLCKFKQESMDLPPPVRGNLISHSDWIRVAHNSFARRLDLLNAALSLQNQIDSRSKSKRAKTSRWRATRKKTKKATTDAAYHFIAFVPVGKTVWQLDGLEANPVRIGEFAPGEHWTSAARPVIEARMTQYETEQLSFSLLAMCGNHLASIRKELAITMASLDALDARWGSSPEWAVSKPDGEVLLGSTNPAKLREYGLGTGDVDILVAGSSNVAETKRVACGLEAEMANAANLWRKLYDDQKKIRDRYATEHRNSMHEVVNVLGRTKDHTPVIHEWVRRLAEHNMLLPLHEEVEMQG